MNETFIRKYRFFFAWQDKGTRGVAGGNVARGLHLKTR